MEKLVVAITEVEGLADALAVARQQVMVLPVQDMCSNLTRIQIPINLSFPGDSGIETPRCEHEYQEPVIPATKFAVART